MTAGTAALSVPLVDDTLARRNAAVLAVAQAIGGAAAPISFGLGGLAGDHLLSLAGWPRTLATLPVTCFVLGMALAAAPASLLMRRTGRRPVYWLGALAIVVAGLGGAASILAESFVGLCLALAFAGAASVIVQSYRFAAADTASARFRPKAVAWVLAGGILAGVIGPQTIIRTQDFFAPVLFAGAFLGQAVLGVILFGVVSLVRLPGPKTDGGGHSGRPLRQIMAQPRFIVAAACGVTSYALMNLVMTASPLAMVACGLSHTDAALGIQWHVMAMYAPSFVTGSLIARFGAPKIVTAGLLLVAASGAVALTGLSVFQFWAALVLLGFGWNLGFLGATTMLLETYRPEERAKTQAANEALVFGSLVVASLSSGGLLQATGWATINLLLFPAVALCLALLAWGGGQSRLASAAG